MVQGKSWIVNTAIELISQFFIYGVDAVLAKIRNARKLEKILNESITEMGQIYNQYGEIANNFEDMFIKCPLSHAAVSDLLVNTDFGNLVHTFRQTDFYSKYCDPTYLTEEKICELLAKFLEIFERKIMEDAELSQELYHAKILKGINELSTAVQHPNVYVIINNLTIIAANLHEERLDNITTKLKLAGEYSSQGKDELAETEYRRCLALPHVNEHPDYWKALNNLARILVETKRVEDAVPYLEQAYEVMPDNLDVTTNLGIAYLKSKKYAEARDKFKIAMQKYPNEAHGAYNSYGVLLAEQGKKEEAIAEIDEAINIKSNESRYIMNKGMLLSELGKHDPAIEEYKKAIAIDPSIPEYYVQMGSAYLLKRYHRGVLQQGKIRIVSFSMLRELGKPLPIASSPDINEALHCFLKAVELGAPLTDAELAINMSMVYVENGQMDKAEDLLHGICTSGIDTPVQIAVRLNLMHIYAWTNQYQKAQDIYHQLKDILKGEELLKLHCTMADIYLFNKQYENAIALYEHVIPQKKDLHILTNFGVCLTEMRRYKDATTYLQEATTLDPKNASVLWDLAVCYHMQNMHGNAASSYAAARELEPEINKPNMGAAISFFHAGHRTLAERELTSLLECHRDKPLINGILADLEHAIGNQEQCRKYLMEVLRLVPKYSHNYYVALQRFQSYFGYDPTSNGLFK